MTAESYRGIWPLGVGSAFDFGADVSLLCWGPGMLCWTYLMFEKSLFLQISNCEPCFHVCSDFFAIDIVIDLAFGILQETQLAVLFFIHPFTIAWVILGVWCVVVAMLNQPNNRSPWLILWLFVHETSSRCDFCFHCLNLEGSLDVILYTWYIVLLDFVLDSIALV